MLEVRWVFEIAVHGDAMGWFSGGRLDSLRVRNARQDQCGAQHGAGDQMRQPKPMSGCDTRDAHASVVSLNNDGTIVTGRRGRIKAGNIAFP
jgi:hypothetical protein